MNPLRLLILGICLASAAVSAADVAILSVTPASGPATGGTEVTLSGRGFNNTCDAPITCLPPQVYFGSLAARETRILNDTTIVAVTPEAFPGPVNVSVGIGLQHFAEKTNAFTFTGPVPESFERLLLPVFVPPVHGAFGSEFHTTFRIAAKNGTVRIWGLDLGVCEVINECINPDDPWRIVPTDEINPRNLDANGTPGRFLFAPKADMANVAANLRVQDVSRAELNYGTEIPVVRESDFAESRIVLQNVPGDPRFRNTLHIYSVNAPFVNVTVAGRQAVQVPLRPGATLNDPAYAEFTDFPRDGGAFRVTIDAPVLNPAPVIEPVLTDIWAFITVTNNETQVISTITPQP